MCRSPSREREKDMLDQKATQKGPRKAIGGELSGRLPSKEPLDCSGLLKVDRLKKERLEVSTQKGWWWWWD